MRQTPHSKAPKDTEDAQFLRDQAADAPAESSSAENEFDMPDRSTLVMPLSREPECCRPTILQPNKKHGDAASGSK